MWFECNVVGSIYFKSATPPCLVCGYRTTCRYGGPATWLAPEQFENFQITPDMFREFEDQLEVVARSFQVERSLADKPCSALPANLPHTGDAPSRCVVWLFHRGTGNRLDQLKRSAGLRLVFWHSIVALGRSSPS